MSRSRSLLAVHASVALFGLAGLFGKWLTLQPHFIVLGRVVFAAAALALIIRLSGGRFSIRRKIDGGLFLLQGLILAVHWILFFESIRVSTVAVGLLAYSSFPVFTAFLEPLFFRTRLSRRHLGLSLACLAGVFLLVPRFSWSERVFQGVVTGLGAGATFALLSIINRKLSFRYASPVVAFYQDAGAALFSSPPPCSSRRLLRDATSPCWRSSGFVHRPRPHAFYRRDAAPFGPDGQHHQRLGAGLRDLFGRPAAWGTAFRPDDRRRIDHLDGGFRPFPVEPEKEEAGGRRSSDARLNVISRRASARSTRPYFPWKSEKSNPPPGHSAMILR